MIDHVQLREAGWLLVAVVPLLLLSLRWLHLHRQRTPYADTHLHDWAISKHNPRQKQRWRRFLFTQLAWLAFAIALAGPRLPLKFIETGQLYTNQLYIVVDLSSSMSAADIQPSRIERAKLELFDLVDRLQQTRAGLIVFAAQPHVLTPPTADKTVLRHYIQTLRAGLLPTAGTETLNAINFAIHQFRPAANQSRAILLISDGEHHSDAQQLNDSLLQLGQQLKHQNIHLYTYGVGTAQGAAILTADKGWLNFENQAVVTYLQENFLQQLADIGNGKYTLTSKDDSDWHALYDQGVAQLPFEALEQQQDEQVQWRELATGFILIGILLLFISLWQQRPAQAHTWLALPLLFLLQLPVSPPANAAQVSYMDAFQLYQQGNYQAAQQAFATLPGFAARLAEANSRYQMQEYKQAIPQYIQAILQATTDQQRIDAIFNLGNCYFKLEQYTDAQQLYQDVLRYHPRHRAASINLDYALALEQKKRDERPITARREGTGPRTADAPPNMDIERGRLSLGDSSNNETGNLSLETDTSPQQAAQILLQQSRPASEQIDYSVDPSWTYDVTSLSELVQTHRTVNVDESILWQRLFELEEGFMAAQEEPTQLPGVKPW